MAVGLGHWLLLQRSRLAFERAAIAVKASRAAGLKHRLNLTPHHFGTGNIKAIAPDS